MVDEPEGKAAVSLAVRGAGATDFVFAVFLGLACYVFKSPGLDQFMPRWLWVGITVFGPLFVISGFWILGAQAGRMRHADTRQRLADNVYFLGFIFTMLSLIFSFLPVAILQNDIRPQDVYYAFGTALLATAVGLIGRVIIMQTGATNEEVAARVEEDLTRLAQGVSEEAERILARLAAAREALGKQSEEVVNAVFAETAPRIRALAEDFGRSSEAVRKRLDLMTAETEQATETLRHSLEARTEDMTAAAKILANSRNELSQSLDHLHGPAEALARDLAAVSKARKDAIAGLRSDLAKLREALESVRETGTRFEAAAGSMESGLGALGTRLETAVGAMEGRANEAAERVGAAASGLASGVEGTRIRIEQVATQAEDFGTNISEAIGTFEKAIDRFTEAVERVGRQEADAGKDQTR